MTPKTKTSVTPKTKTSVTPKSSLKEKIDVKPKNANPLNDYIALSMDLVKLEVFLLEKLDIDKKDKKKFIKEHLDPLLKRTEDRIALLKDLQTKHILKSNENNNRKIK